MGEPRTPTKAERKALLGIQGCIRSDGWTTMWPADVSRKALESCVEAGWLERSIKGEGRLPFVAYRMTATGEAALKAQEEAKSGG